MGYAVVNTRAGEGVGAPSVDQLAGLLAATTTLILVYR